MSDEKRIEEAAKRLEELELDNPIADRFHSKPLPADDAEALDRWLNKSYLMHFATERANATHAACGWNAARAHEAGKVKRLVEALDVALELANTPEQHQDERWCERREWCESVSREFEGGE